MIKISSAPTIFKISLTAIWANKMRSALTSLGIIIGVAAVIAMMAVGDGSSKDINERVSNMGSNVITLRAGAAFGRRRNFNAAQHKRLTLDDVAALVAEGTTIKTAYPTIGYTFSVVNGNQKVDASITATTNEIFDVQTWDVAYGRIFTRPELDGGVSVCVLGSVVADKLFGDIDPVDATIRINNVPFKVVGVLAPVGQGMGGGNQDEGLIIPVKAGISKLGWVGNGPKYINNIVIQSVGFEEMAETEAEITAIMRQRHRLKANQENDFTLMNLTQMLETMKEVTRTMSLLLAAIAGISLLVGGIGIMNIMLVSVTERTREIGIRMAIGASTWDIRLQFLTEAVILSLFGGIVGILTGVGIAYAIKTFAAMSIDITLTAILLASGFSAFMGIAFGFYPAYKASKLNPIDALRFE